MGVGELYAEERRRISDLVLALADEEADRRLPTCPRWTVGRVVSHLVGVCADVLAGNVAGVATEPWTAEQVRARKGRRLAELVDEWSDVGPRVEAFADNFPGLTGAQWVTDIATHEHDIRSAVGQPGARDSRGVEVGLNFLVTVGLDSAVSARGLAPLVIQAGERSWVVGTGEAIAAQGEEEIARAADERLMATLLSGDPAPKDWVRGCPPCWRRRRLNCSAPSQAGAASPRSATSTGLSTLSHTCRPSSSGLSPSAQPT